MTSADRAILRARVLSNRANWAPVEASSLQHAKNHEAAARAQDKAAELAALASGKDAAAHHAQLAKDHRLAAATFREIAKSERKPRR